MQKLCTNCHYIGKPKRRREPTYFGIIFTASLGSIFLILAFWHPAFLIGTFLSISYSLLFLSEFFNYSQLCPKCDKTLVPLNSKNAQKVISNNKLDVVRAPDSISNTLTLHDCTKYGKRVICSNCYTTGAGIIEGLCHLRMGIIVLSLGFISILLAFLTPLSLIGSFIYIVFGLTMVLCCFVEDRVCPKCKTQTMIPLNTPKAKSILTENKIDTDNEAIIPTPPVFNYMYGLYIIFASWILIGYFIYRLYGFFNVQTP